MKKEKKHGMRIEMAKMVFYLKGQKEWITTT